MNSSTTMDILIVQQQQKTMQCNSVRMVKIQLSYQNQHSQVGLSWERSSCARGDCHVPMTIIISIINNIINTIIVNININIISIILNTTPITTTRLTLCKRQLSRRTAVNCNAASLQCIEYCSFVILSSTVCRGNEKPITVLWC